MCAEQGVHVGAATAFDADLPLQCLDKLLLCVCSSEGIVSVCLDFMLYSGQENKV